MTLTKGCKRCGGDLSLEYDEDGLYLACIQCSAVESELTKLIRMRIGNHLMSESNWWEQLKVIRIGEPDRRGGRVCITS